jgi:hypothetical protein
MVMPLAVAPTLMSGAGCAGNDCAADVQTLPKCAGEPIDADHWESGPVDGTYLDFHGERTWVLDPSGWMGSRKPFDYEAYLALSPQPNAEGGSGFAQSAGNLAELTLSQVGDAWQVEVLNDTCAQYYLRVVLTYPAEGAGGSATGACATARDAGTD